VFKRTADFPAGYLVEQAGLKGLRLGDAQISPRHANVLVNLGHASAADMRTLMRAARLVVQDRFGQVLEPEIELVGEWAPDPATPPPWRPA
jgi:UDP-N-acetylmuramate dehydrogenase